MADAVLWGDRARQGLTVAAALAQVVLPTVAGPSPSRGPRPPDVVQPAGATFAIWLPIFAGGLGYAAHQARPSQRSSVVLRAVGWPLAAAFASTGIWAPLARARRTWPAQAALVGIAGFADVAQRRLAHLERSGALSSTDTVLVAPVTGLLAGWGTVAAGVNLAAVLVDARIVPPRRATATGMAVLLGLGATALAKNAGEGGRAVATRAYLSAVLWALGGVGAGKRRSSPVLSGTALALATALSLAVALRAQGTGGPAHGAA